MTSPTVSASFSTTPSAPASDAPSSPLSDLSSISQSLPVIYEDETTLTAMRKYQESLRQYTQRQLGEFKKEVEARGRRSSL